jgi:hypothetical protein
MKAITQSASSSVVELERDAGYLAISFMNSEVCVVTLGARSSAPKGHPRRVLQSFEQGIANLQNDLAHVGFDGEFRHWTNRFPPGSPRHDQTPFGFKPYCVSDAYQSGFPIVLWMDSSIRVKKSIGPLIDHIRREGYLIFREDHSVGEYCKDEALATLGMTREEGFEMPCCWSCVLGLDLSQPQSQEFLRLWMEKASDGITFSGPKWSGVMGWPRTASADSRVKGHRHDQTAASVIALQLGMNHWQSKAVFFEYFDNDRLSVRNYQEHNVPLWKLWARRVREGFKSVMGLSGQGKKVRVSHKRWRGWFAK